MGDSRDDHARRSSPPGHRGGLGSAMFGAPEGVASAMKRLRTALDDTEHETEPAERSALQRSQRCKSE
jgi:hypothetical protein